MSPRRRLSWFLLIVMPLIAVVVTCIVFAPAAWLSTYVEAHSRVRLVYPTGTIWNGSAMLALTDGKTARVLPGRISWRIQWAELATGHLPMLVHHPSAEGPVAVRFDGRTVSVDRGRMFWSAAMLETLGAPFNTILPGGRLRLRWTDTTWGDGALTGTFQLDWDDAQSALSPVAPLGSFRIVVKANGAQGNATLTTRRGPLLLEGQGQLNQGHLTFTGTADSEPDSREMLNGLIGVLGPRQGDIVALDWEIHF